MRYLPLTDADRAAMLAVIGVDRVDDLFRDVPKDLLNADIDLPTVQSEIAVTRHMRRMASANLSASDAPCFIGAGAYRHHVPASVDHIIQRGEFLTAYTPYQPEIAQGTLQYIYEFQSQVAALTGMEVANASLYDGSTSCAEAILMAHRITKRSRALLCGNLHPHYRRVSETMVQFMDDALVPCLSDPGNPQAELDDVIARIDDRTSCVVVQNPGICGHVLDLAPVADAAHAAGALLVVVVAEALSMGLVKSPGAMGADIVAAEGQSIGGSLNFGGPYLGLFATRKSYVRQMPGRLAGETTDAHGKRGFVLTLSTREQHIRREKATSNICTNSGLCSLAFTAHMALLGRAGLGKLARINHARTAQLRSALLDIGLDVLTDRFFNEIAVRLPKPADAVVDWLAEEGILGGVALSRLDPAADPHILLLAATELVTDSDIADLTDTLKESVA